MSNYLIIVENEKLANEIMHLLDSRRANLNLGGLLHNSNVRKDYRYQDKETLIHIIIKGTNYNEFLYDEVLDVTYEGLLKSQTINLSSVFIDEILENKVEELTSVIDDKLKTLHNQIDVLVATYGDSVDSNLISKINDEINALKELKSENEKHNQKYKTIDEATNYQLKLIQEKINTLKNEKRNYS